MLCLVSVLRGQQEVVAPAKGLYTVTPCRVADTRDASGPYGGPALTPNSDRTFVFTGRCGIPSTADSVVLNVTVTGATASGDLRIYPAGLPLASASSIGYSAGKTRANNGNYGIGSGGGISVHCDQGTGMVQAILMSPATLKPAPRRRLPAPSGPAAAATARMTVRRGWRRMGRATWR